MGWAGMQSMIIVVDIMRQQQYTGGASMDDRDVWMRN
jgi:hypothetical protein